MDIGLLLLRLTVGLTLAAHGAQKLFGWFGGPGLEATGKTVAMLGFQPGRRHALTAGLVEAGGGLLLAFGFLTPVAAAVMLAVMLVAGVSVHLKQGFFITSGGYEYTLVLGVAGFAHSAVTLGLALVLAGGLASPVAAHDYDNPHPGAPTQPVPAEASLDLTRIASTSSTGSVNSDLAFWGTTAYMGVYHALQVVDIADPAHPRVLGEMACHGSQNDVSVWDGLLFMSIDRPQTSPGCDAASTCTTPRTRCTSARWPPTAARTPTPWCPTRPTGAC